MRPDLEIALKWVSFKLVPGDKICVIGKSGSGKSCIGYALTWTCEVLTGCIIIDE